MPQHRQRRVDPGHVRREGAGQWVLVGPPNAGKSALLAALTHAHPEVAPYPFTTHAPQPGMMPFEDVQVQLVDTPAVASAHTESYMANLVRNADGVLLVLDPTVDDLGKSLAACHGLVERARVWPRTKPLPPDASPLLVVRPVYVVLNKCDLDGDGICARTALPRCWTPVQSCRARSSELGSTSMTTTRWPPLSRRRRSP